jgi:GNAT superfamily N-acetyltransferase
MLPLALEHVQAFWRRIGAAVAKGERALLIAEDAQGMIACTVQLVLDQPDNQPHRSVLAKMLVHSRARRLGLGTALTLAAEELGRDCGKTLAVLDTATGSDAERLYTRRGWMPVGRIPAMRSGPAAACAAPACSTNRLERLVLTLGGSKWRFIAACEHAVQASR